MSFVNSSRSFVRNTGVSPKLRGSLASATGPGEIADAANSKPAPVNTARLDNANLLKLPTKHSLRDSNLYPATTMLKMLTISLGWLLPALGPNFSNMSGAGRKADKGRHREIGTTACLDRHSLSYYRHARRVWLVYFPAPLLRLIFPAQRQCYSINCLAHICATYDPPQNLIPRGWRTALSWPLRGQRSGVFGTPAREEVSGQFPWQPQTPPT